MNENQDSSLVEQMIKLARQKFASFETFLFIVACEHCNYQTDVEDLVKHCIERHNYTEGEARELIDQLVEEFQNEEEA